MAAIHNPSMAQPSLKFLRLRLLLPAGGGPVPASGLWRAAVSRCRVSHYGGPFRLPFGALLGQRGEELSYVAIQPWRCDIC
jgi:hypothetical protein